MRRKELLFGVFCGAVGAILATAVGLFTPLVAQNDVMDAKFDTVNCRMLIVEDEDGKHGVFIFGGSVIARGEGEGRVRMGAGVIAGEAGGHVVVYERDEKNVAKMAAEEDGGYVYVFSKDGTGNILMPK